ncbi:hypothetical protein B0T25DRAFT_515898 [Lasiosphaeria hispida]|uniref:Ankyrin repeat protein n=1 Tax=Lasiosphaeria hispida TaxID=260671 RepID=A0AAJ0MIT2_9PEZI|nr:hypothetical protein B0T25DRAFT_515898 [Lasiosphaeria hispida]
MGRPCTAAEIWQRDFMRHALTRMYLYTMLSVEDISKVLTVVAKNRIGSHLSSGTRSTSAQLKELLAEKDTRLDPQKLRPQSDVDAQERAGCWRSLKRYRKEKAFQRHHRTAIRRSSLRDVCQAPHGHCEAKTDDDPSSIVSQTPDVQHVLLSWVQHALPDIPEERRSEIRSLLSWRSSQCSTISRTSSTCSRRGQIGSQTQASPTSDGGAFSISQSLDVHHNLAPLVETSQGVDWAEIAPWTDGSARADGTFWTDPPRPAEQAVPASTTLYHSIIGKLCCGNRRDCLHRKVFAAIMGHDPTDGLATPLLTRQDFSSKYGRDMFGDTILHIAARWASVDQFRAWHLEADPLAMNLRNVDGDTFVHILGPLWIGTQPKALLEILTASCDQGFNFLARNLGGKTFFSCLLPPTSANIDTTQLHDLTNSLQYMLLQTPSHILMPSLLAQAPVPQPQAVADYMENLLSSHAKTATDHRTRVFALSVSRLFRDKVRLAGVVHHPTPPIPAPNLMHQHLQYLQHLQHLSVTPWEAPPPGAVFQEHLDDGADPNEYDHYNSTSMPCTAAVLHHVSLGHLTEKDGVSLLTLLHQHGANLGLVTGDGETPLHMAIRLGLPDAVAALIRLGADLMAFNMAGKSALYYPLVQKALLREKSADSKRYACAHRILVSVVDAAAKLGLPRPHNFLRAQANT